MHLQKLYIENLSQVLCLTYQITCYKHAWREGRISTFTLSIWVPNDRNPITFCTSIIENLEDNRSLSILSVMDKIFV